MLRDPQFCFDYFLRSRSGLDLARRVDTLLLCLNRPPAAAKRKASSAKQEANGEADSKKAKTNKAAKPAPVKKENAKSK